MWSEKPMMTKQVEQAYLDEITRLLDRLGSLRDTVNDQQNIIKRLRADKRQMQADLDDMEERLHR